MQGSVGARVELALDGGSGKGGGVHYQQLDRVNAAIDRHRDIVISRLDGLRIGIGFRRDDGKIELAMREFAQPVDQLLRLDCLIGRHLRGNTARLHDRRLIHDYLEGAYDLSLAILDRQADVVDVQIQLIRRAGDGL